MRPLVLVLTLLLCSCQQQQQEVRIFPTDDMHYVKEWFSEDGVLEYRQSFMKTSNDSLIEHGLLKKFYPSGQKKYYANFHRGNKIGTVYRFFENGAVQEVWFYNPLGKALYGLKYDSLGNLLEELAREQRYPQIILKDLDPNLVEVKVYSVNIPNRKKSVFLSNPEAILDSTINTSNHYDLFVIPKDTSWLQIAVDYFDSSSGELIETDLENFRLE